MDGGGGSGGAEIQYNSILDFTPKILKVYENDGVTKYTTKQVRQMKLITLFTKYNVKPEGLES